MVYFAWWNSSHSRWLAQ